MCTAQIGGAGQPHDAPVHGWRLHTRRVFRGPGATGQRPGRVTTGSDVSAADAMCDAPARWRRRPAQVSRSVSDLGSVLVVLGQGPTLSGPCDGDSVRFPCPRSRSKRCAAPGCSAQGSFGDGTSDRVRPRRLYCKAHRHITHALIDCKNRLCGREVRRARQSGRVCVRARAHVHVHTCELFPPSPSVLPALTRPSVSDAGL